MDGTDWTTPEMVMAALLGFGVVRTFASNGPSVAIARFFAHLASRRHKGSSTPKRP